MEQDHYAILGVAPTADQAAIRDAYRALMRRYHPDADASSEAAEQARAINQAYAVLGAPEKRVRYDGSLESRSPLRFVPTSEVLPARKGVAIAPVLAIGFVLVAAGMVAFAIMPPTEPLPFGAGTPRDARLGTKHAQLAAADRADVGDAPPIALALANPTQVRAEPQRVGQKEIEPVPEPAAPIAALPERPVEPAAAVADVPKPAAGQPDSRASSCPSMERRMDRLMCDDPNLASLDRQLTLLYRQSYARGMSPSARHSWERDSDSTIAAMPARLQIA